MPTLSIISTSKVAQEVRMVAGRRLLMVGVLLLVVALPVLLLRQTLAEYLLDARRAQG